MPAYLEILSRKTDGQLWPLQEEAVNKGLLDSKWRSFVVSAPHGSGKTLIAELAVVRKLHEKHTAQILYLVPYKAMAREIYEKFSFLEKPPFGREVGIWTGDQAFDDESSLKCNFLVLTYELFQLFLKSEIDRILNCDLLIVDELHFIEESTRGPRQEAAITRLLTLPEHPPILALCSVVSNLDEVHKWLGCGEYYVSTKWRKNSLFEGIVNPEKLTIEFYKDGELIREEPLPVDRIESKLSLLNECCRNYLQKREGPTKPQILVFAPTRREARTISQQISRTLSEPIASGDIDISEDEIRHLHNQLKDTRYSSSSTLDSFKSLFSTGVAYHHAGLGRNLRSLIENQFIENRILVLVATTTLGVGVNLPASRVYFIDTKAGPQALSPIQYRNMAGRAGRPQYQETGESIILCEAQLEMHSSLEEYIRNPTPKLESYLLRNPSETQGALLSWISQGLGALSELEKIVSKSFGAPEIDSQISEKIGDALVTLQTFDFVFAQDTGSGPRYNCTSLGFAAASCGARPDDSAFLVSNLKPENLVDERGAFDRVAVLFYICLTSRFDSVFVPVEIRDPSTFNTYLSKVNQSARSTALSARNRTKNAFIIAVLLNEWISGKSLDDIGQLMGEDGSGEELIERYVPNAVEMLQYYLDIARRCSPNNIGTNEHLIKQLQLLCDSLELGADNDKIELARLLRRREDGRKILEQLNNLGISTPMELLEFPYESFPEKDARMRRDDFFIAKTRALLLIDDIEKRRIEYVRLLSRHLFVHDEIIEKLLSNDDDFEEGVRMAIDGIANTWPKQLIARQVRDRGTGSRIPRPESYLVFKDDENPLKFCFEAKIQKNAAPIESHDKALSVLKKCRGDSTHWITIGSPSFHRDLHNISSDRHVTLIDSSTFALVYIWVTTEMLGLRKLLATLDRTGIIQPDAFDPRVPRWWPLTQII